MPPDEDPVEERVEPHVHQHDGRADPRPAERVEILALHLEIEHGDQRQRTEQEIRPHHRHHLRRLAETVQLRRDQRQQHEACGARCQRHGLAVLQPRRAPGVVLRAMVAGGEHADRQQQPDAHDVEQAEHAARERRRRELHRAHPADHRRIRDADQHLAHLRHDHGQGERQRQAQFSQGGLHGEGEVTTKRPKDSLIFAARPVQHSPAAGTTDPPRPSS
jgi:hypothetical protein